MVCARCGKDIESDAAFCRHCGASQSVGGAPRRLVRLPSQGRIAGVCAGIADYLNTDITLVRLAWVLLSIIPGALLGGALSYLAAWILLPESQAAVHRDGAARLTRSADRKIAGVCSGIAEFIDIDPTVVRVVWAVLAIVPGCIVFGVLAYLVAWFIMPEPPGSTLVPSPHAA
jgi:phage shock protein PspC (stress-responsive transcriptional regulator)